jgi:hypothetical protein
MGKLPSCISPDCLKKIQSLNEDNEVKKVVEKNLDTAGTSIDALQATIAKANEYIAKGAGDRKKAADIQKWKNAMTKYKMEMNQLPAEYKNAEKNYLSLAGWQWPGKPDQAFTGDAAYQNKMFYDYLQEAEKKKGTALAESAVIREKLHTLVNSYRSGLIYASKMDDLLQIRENENENLRKAINEMRDITLTNDRRVYYEDKERDSLSYNRYIIYYFLYGLFVLYFLFGSKGLTLKTLTTQGFYKERAFWMIVILDIMYLTLPLWVNWLVRSGFRIYNQIKYFSHNKAPRDVYSSI